MRSPPTTARMHCARRIPQLILCALSSSSAAIARAAGGARRPTLETAGSTRRGAATLATRHRVLSVYLRDRDWDLDDEARLLRHFIACDRPDDDGPYFAGFAREALRLRGSFPFLYAYEWPASLAPEGGTAAGAAKAGRGDLILSDAQCDRFLVLECKYIDNDTPGSTSRVRRTRKRGEVVKQAELYARAFFDAMRPSNPDAVVLTVAVTNEGIAQVAELTGSG